MTQPATTEYVMLFRGKEQGAAAEAVGRIRRMVGVKIIRQRGDRLLLVEVAAGDTDFPTRANAAEEWTVSRNLTYRLA